MDPQVRESFTIWAANKMDLCFQEWNHNQFCLIHRKPHENPPWNGNPDCWRFNRDFFNGQRCPSFQWNCCYSRCQSNICDVKKKTEASVSYALCYFWRYPIFMPHGEKKTSKNDSLLGPMVIFTRENKKNLCIPIVFLGVRLHVWYIAHLSINGSISRRFISITSTLCMTAWFYFVCIWHRYFSDVHHDLLSCSVHIVAGYMSSLSHNDVCGYSKSFVPCCKSSIRTSYIKTTHSSSVRHKTCGHFFLLETKQSGLGFRNPPRISSNFDSEVMTLPKGSASFQDEIPFFDKWSFSLRRLEWTRSQHRWSSSSSQWPTIRQYHQQSQSFYVLQNCKSKWINMSVCESFSKLDSHKVTWKCTAFDSDLSNLTISEVWDPPKSSAEAIDSTLRHFS